MSIKAKYMLTAALFVILGAITGFYFGFSYGAKVMGAVASQTNLMSSMRAVERSVDALEKNDLASAQKELQIDLRIALVDISTHALLHLSITCTDRNIEAMKHAKRYLDASQNVEWLKVDDTFAPALKACPDK